MNSKVLKDEIPEMLDPAEDDTDVIVEDYKDLEIETLASSRDKTLWGMKDYD